MAKLLKIDSLTKSQHYYLEDNDLCWYLMTYTAGESYHNPQNQRILNFKKSLVYKDTNSWKYKIDEINSLSQIFSNIFEDFRNDSSYIFVPIPPSKCKADELYDDRLVQVLRGVDGLDVRELLITNQSIEAVHNQEQRPSIQELEDNMTIDENLITGDIQNIILFDDVLTTGAHYKACMNKLYSILPQTVRIFGVFIARREVPPSVDEIADDLLF